MSEVKIINGQSLPNMPWQDRPAQKDAADTPLWRYSANPIMGRNPTPEIGRIFNSAVAPWKDGYIAVLRGEQVNGVPHVYLGRSKDGIHWEVDREKVNFVDEEGNPFTAHSTNPVPFCIVGADVHLRDGRLADIAPTMLDLMGLNQPEEMDGKTLIV